MCSVVNKKVKSKESSLNENSGYDLTNGAYFVDPIFAYFLGGLWDIGSLDIFDRNLLNSLLGQSGKTELFDTLEYIDPEFLDYFHYVCKFNGVKFLYKHLCTAFDVSWRSLRDWIVTCKLATLSCFFHFYLSSFLFRDKIFMYVLKQTVV